MPLPILLRAPILHAMDTVSDLQSVRLQKIHRRYLSGATCVLLEPIKRPARFAWPTPFIWLRPHTGAETAMRKCFRYLPDGKFRSPRKPESSSRGDPVENVLLQPRGFPLDSPE